MEKAYALHMLKLVYLLIIYNEKDFGINFIQPVTKPDVGLTIMKNENANLYMPPTILISLQPTKG